MNNEANAKYQRIIAKQKAHIHALTRELEADRAVKADHLYRLRMLLVEALGNAQGWQDKARKELGVTNSD